MPHTDNKTLFGREGNHHDAVLASRGSARGPRLCPDAHRTSGIRFGVVPVSPPSTVLTPPPVVICKRCNRNRFVGKVGKMAKSVRMLTTKLPALLACGCC